MKKLLVAFLTLFLFVGVINAQDKELEKEVKKANRSLSNYLMDTKNNADKLHEAVKAIDEIFTNSNAKKSANAWLVKAEINNEIASQINTIKQLGFGDVESLPQSSL